MADPADIAGETIDTCNAEAQRRWSKAAAPEAQPGFSEWDGYTCVDCGDDMICERILMQRCRCVGCQSLLEVKSR